MSTSDPPPASQQSNDVKAPKEPKPWYAEAFGKDYLNRYAHRSSEAAAGCIFPEGKSHSEPAMLPFKQGLARIALGYDGPLAIVPVGLYYEQKDQFRSAVSVRFGPPLDPRDHQGSAAALTQEIRCRIEALMAQFERSRDAPLAEWVGQLLESEESPARRPELTLD